MRPSPAAALGALVPALLLAAPALSAEFNYEVERRVRDQLENFMSQAVDANVLLSNYRYGGGFGRSGSLVAADRDAYLTLANSLAIPDVYVGLEDGTHMSRRSYREPGDSGYLGDDGAMRKHLDSCVNRTTGEPVECLLSPGDSYIRCVDGCAPEPCADADSQANCTSADAEEEEEEAACESRKKWCRRYDILQDPGNRTDERERRGYVPITQFCRGIDGMFTEEPGRVVKGDPPLTEDLAAVVNPLDGSSSVHELGNCTYDDGVTPVSRSLTGAYAYCGSDGEICSDVFVGGFQSANYDPRVRPWYIQSKEVQRPTWTEPYPFASLGLGITATHPIYDVVEGRNLFAGVLAIDYTFDEITNFLVTEWGGMDVTDISVAVYEDKEPYYIIGLSTGAPASQLVLSADDPTQPCPDEAGTLNSSCEPLRVKMSELRGSTEENVQRMAFEAHLFRNYPEGDLITVRSGCASMTDDCGIFLSQSALYEQPGANLRWRVIVSSPSTMTTTDSLLQGDPLFGTVLAIGTLGIAMCCGFFGIFYSKRNERAVIFADWRFTCLFILGCALFNGSSLALVGPNTDGLCLTRMWTFHLFLVMTVSPLFVKIWRMWKLVGSKNIHRAKISVSKTLLYMVPMLCTQIFILLVVSLADPPRQTSQIEVMQGLITNDLICAHNTPALFITELIYEAGLIVAGCYLAYLTRNVDERFGEAKQLIFSMYNIAFIGVVFLIVVNVATITPAGKNVLQAVAVLWGTVFSSAAFVIPRLIGVRRAKDKRPNNIHTNIQTTTAA